MKLGLTAFLLWSCAMISGALVPGALAQCTAPAATQLCGGSVGAAESAQFTFAGQTKNSQLIVGNGVHPTPLTVSVCNGGGASCTSPTAAQTAAKFANIPSGGACTSDPGGELFTCAGTLPPGWSSGPATGPGLNVVTFTYSPPNTNTDNLVFSIARGGVAPTAVYTQGATAGALATLLSNKMVCVKHSQRSPAGPGPSTTWYNQEWHPAGSFPQPLTDYKMGPVHATDPSKVIGTWSIGGAGECTLTYDYNGLIFNYTVWQTGASVSFCQGTTATVTIPTAQILPAAGGPITCGSP